ncbi:hypothetical protein [Gilvibacter sp.]|uniref:hypothetical protein n=1 Tax=Gilvibacter sp. TaxID=2729997 RepID=UPI0025C15C88|nr:hypothetical protein [Gilvibacter sp.]NQX77756.1 hypothetical protein [Gilvibacter sp.]
MIDHFVAIPVATEVFWFDVAKWSQSDLRLRKTKGFAALVANATLSRLDFLDTFSSMEKVSEKGARTCP